MQIKIGNKTYKSVKPTMGLVRELIKLSDEISSYDAILSSDDEQAKLNLIEKLHPLNELETRLDILVRYFGNQFTEQDFLDGYIVQSMADFHALIYNMISEAVLGITLPVGGEKKLQTKTSKKVSH